MNKTRIKNDLVESTSNLLDILFSVSEAHFNTSTPKGGWSIGMIAEHLIKVESGTLNLFSGPVERTGRDPSSKIESIRDRLLDFDSSMTAYGPIVPDEKPKDKTKALEKMQDIRQKLKGLIEIQDMTETITGFEHPLFGYLTHVEWIYFNIFHSRRHVNQMKQTLASIRQLNA